MEAPHSQGGGVKQAVPVTCTPNHQYKKSKKISKLFEKI